MPGTTRYAPGHAVGDMSQTSSQWVDGAAQGLVSSSWSTVGLAVVQISALCSMCVCVCWPAVKATCIGICCTKAPAARPSYRGATVAPSKPRTCSPPLARQRPTAVQRLRRGSPHPGQRRAAPAASGPIHAVLSPALGPASRQLAMRAMQASQEEAQTRLHG